MSVSGILQGIIVYCLVHYFFPLVGGFLMGLWVKQKENLWRGVVAGIVCCTCFLIIVNTLISNYNESLKQPQAHSWTLTAANPIGKAWDTSRFVLFQVEIKGTWGAGTLTIEGSSNGTDYLKLRDPSNIGSPISITSNPITPIVIWETPNYLRPVLTGADGRDSLTVTVAGRH